MTGKVRRFYGIYGILFCGFVVNVAVCGNLLWSFLVCDSVKYFYNCIFTEINFKKFLKFLNPFSIVKMVQTSQNTLEVLKNQNRGILPHTPQAFKKV